MSYTFNGVEYDDAKENSVNTKRAELLKAAENCICQDRDIQYGSPENSFSRIAEYWATYLGVDITAHDVGIMMALFKIARIDTGHCKDDNYIDAIGYIACAGEIGKGQK